MRLASTAYNPVTGAYTAQIEAVTKILDVAWDAGKATATTLYYFEKALEQSAEGLVGGIDEVSTVWEEGTYWYSNTNSVTPDGELSTYTYTREGAPKSYKVPYSFWRIGIEFTQRQIDYLANASLSRYDLVQTEFNMKTKNLMNVHNRMLINPVGAPAYGTGTFLLADQIWDIFGLRYHLNNANPFYTNVRPGSGELNCVNVPAGVIPANGMYATFSNWQSQVRANNEAAPTLLIAPEICRQNFVSEMINVYAGGPGGAGARAVGANQGGQNMTDFKFNFDHVDFIEWGNGINVILEPLMPGTGAGQADNEFLFVNPNDWEMKWHNNRYYTFDPFRAGGQNQPNIIWSNGYLHWVLHGKNPKGQLRAVSQTVPVV
jgi:hypothetical protein